MNNLNTKTMRVHFHERERGNPVFSAPKLQKPEPATHKSQQHHSETFWINFIPRELNAATNIRPHASLTALNNIKARSQIGSEYSLNNCERSLFGWHITTLVIIVAFVVVTRGATGFGLLVKWPWAAQWDSCPPPRSQFRFCRQLPHVRALLAIKTLIFVVLCSAVARVLWPRNLR